MATLFRVGSRVQETAPPHRRGTVRSVLRTGTYQRVLVGIDGGTQVWFYPSALTLA